MLADCVTPVAVYKSFAGDHMMNLACQLVLETPSLPTQMSFLRYLSIFALTCALEFPVYWFVNLRSRTRAQQVFAVLVLNLATHPLVTWYFPRIFFDAYRPYRDLVLASELFAPLVEALLLRHAFKQTWARATIGAVAANLFSWWLGLYLGAYLPR